ncbi:hypothetical protein BD779DRAFT_1402509, partial [Infundibulicybe gibba]
CDVGAGAGSFGIKLFQEHPHLKITLCDFPSVMKETGEASCFQWCFWGNEYPHVVKEGQVEFLPIDLFGEVPEGRDVYYVRYV